MAATAQPATNALAIRHIAGSSPHKFELVRADGKSLEAKAIPSPYDAAVTGHPGPLMKELRWYLENFLDYPFPPETAHAEHVLESLKAWGTAAFNALFDRRDAGSWLADADRLQIRSDDANVLSWPWEALFDPLAGSYIAHQRRIERRLSKVDDPPKLGDLPKDGVRILLVVARPYTNDVGYRSIARSLVELIAQQNIPAEVTLLRPPTFDNLRDHLHNNPKRYHVLHFDGHGAFGDGVHHASYSPDKFQAAGCLVFEDKDGKPDAKAASDFSALLREHALPAVVLNACQSAAMDAQAESPFASVAAALLQSGMRSVVAMSYSLYVSGAQRFLPAFYQRLFEEGDLTEAVRAGRQQMLAKKERTSPRGPFVFEDWLLPVLYQQAPIDLKFGAKGDGKKRASRLPEEIRDVREAYGFIGRDSAILEMERALQRQAPCLLIQGLGGVGKTTLARGFLRWLDETDGLDGALWFDFREIRSSEYVINRMGQALYGENFAVQKNKLQLLADAFRQVRIVVVWDNFESATQNLPAADRSDLSQFLEAIRATKGKVIITSRSEEEWLASHLRYSVSLRGLDGEERWEFCETVLGELGMADRLERDHDDLVKLLRQLAGHPLAMRVVLPKLERMRPDDIREALRNNIAALGLDPNEENGRLFGTLRFVEQGLPEALQGLLPLVGLHEAFVDADYLGDMGQETEPKWTRNQIDQLLSSLAAAGLLKDLGQATFEMHPLLRSYLRAYRPADELTERAFARVMAELTDRLAPLELHQQRWPFHFHGANFRAALALADKWSMTSEAAALVQSLASHAENTQNFADATRLLDDLARRAALTNDPEQEAGAYHQLGNIADLQRDFPTARDWYLKSLAISEKQAMRVGSLQPFTNWEISPICNATSRAPATGTLNRSRSAKSKVTSPVLHRATTNSETSPTSRATSPPPATGTSNRWRSQKNWGMTTASPAPITNWE